MRRKEQEMSERNNWTAARERKVRWVRLSLDYDLQPRGEDETRELHASEDRDGLITDYIHHHAERIAEMAGVEDLVDVEDPEDPEVYVVVDEYIEWVDGPERKKKQQERVVAEAELLAGATYLVVRDEHGDYHTEYREGVRARRDYQRSLGVALRRFVEVVEDEEAELERAECGEGERR